MAGNHTVPHADNKSPIQTEFKWQVNPAFPTRYRRAWARMAASLNGWRTARFQQGLGQVLGLNHLVRSHAWVCAGCHEWLPAKAGIQTSGIHQKRRFALHYFAVCFAPERKVRKVKVRKEVRAETQQKIKPLQTLPNPALARAGGVFGMKQVRDENLNLPIDFGSQKRRNTMSKSCTEDCRALDVRKINRAGRLAPGSACSWVWSRNGETVATIHMLAGVGSVTLGYRQRAYGGEWRDMNYPVRLAYTPCHMGGQRVWWQCPGAGCGRRVACGGAVPGRQHLCLPPLLPVGLPQPAGQQRLWACRQAQGAHGLGAGHCAPARRQAQGDALENLLAPDERVPPPRQPGRGRFGSNAGAHQGQPQPHQAVSSI